MMNVNIPAKVGGRFKFEAVNAITGKRRLLRDWTPNLITNGGLDRMPAGAYLTYCLLGTGSTTPAVTNTTLAAYSIHATALSTTDSNSGASPWYSAVTKVYRFNPRGSTYNYSEVGVGWGTTTNLFSRALIVDGVGSPTTITQLADEYVDVTYELRLYPPETDSVFNVTDTETLIEHTITSRAAQVDLSNPAGWKIADGLFTIGLCSAFEAGISSIDSEPSGTSAAGTVSIGGYTAGTFSHASTVSFGISVANFATGIGSFRISNGTGSMRYQLGVSPKIMKTATDSLSISFSWSWARKTL